MRGYDRAKDIGGDPKTLPWFAAGNTGVDPDTSSGHTDDLRCGQLCQGEGEDHGTKKLGAMWGASQLNLAVEEAVMVPLVMHRHCWAAKGGWAISQRRGGAEEGSETVQLP